MQIHVPTLYYLMCGVSLLAAGKMALEWRRERLRPLLLWSLGNLAVAISVLLMFLRPLGYFDISIGLSNAILLLGYAVGWRGAAVFTGRRAPWPLVLLGAAVWSLAWTYPPFAGNVDQRIFLSSLFIAAYSFATAFCFLRAPVRLTSTIQAGFAFLLHGGLYIGRIGSLALASGKVDPLQLNNLPLAIVIFEGVLFIVVTAYLFLAMTRERGELLLMAASQTDYLTGVPNRRAFTEQARQFVADGNAGAAVIFDLDHFKSINDRYGHAVGDEVLKLFCRVVRDGLGPADVFGRMGGEEFAAVMPGDDIEIAQRKAADIVARFAAEAPIVAGCAVGSTVSAGLSAYTGALDLDQLFAKADAALYAAKRSGRNRLVTAGEAEASARNGLGETVDVPDAEAHWRPSRRDPLYPTAADAETSTIVASGGRVSDRE